REQEERRPPIEPEPVLLDRRGSAAHRRLSLDHSDLEPRGGKQYRARQPAGACTDNNDLLFCHGVPVAPTSIRSFGAATAVQWAAAAVRWAATAVRWAAAAVHSQPLDIHRRP